MSGQGADLAATLRQATERLRQGVDPVTPRLDAELLAAHLLGVSRADMLAREGAALDRQAYDALLARREAGEPIAHIIGRAEFWSLPLQVTADTLIPRPDSEALIELALSECGKRAPKTIVDLGTGSGCLLLAALSEWRQAEGLGVDASPAAVRIAANNAQALGFAARAAFFVADWAVLSEGSFDLMLCNPPYIAEDDDRLGAGVRDFEPHDALFAGDNGLAAFRSAFATVARTLASDGIAVFEIGAGQADAVTALASSAGLKPAGQRQDLAGHVRALGFRHA